MSKVKLKPCLSCGNDQCLVETYSDESYVTCQKCGVDGPTGSYEDCVRLWNADGNQKIKMTKTLPTEPGRYFWHDDQNDLRIVDIVFEHYSCDRGHQKEKYLVSEFHNEYGDYSVEHLGGCWAKVDYSMFELEA